MILKVKEKKGDEHSNELANFKIKVKNFKEEDLHLSPDDIFFFTIGKHKPH